MAEQISRQELEKKVVNARSKINLSQEDFGWLTSQETSDFLRAWLDLHAYYLTHDGDTTEIDFEIMRSYFDVERFLQEILRNPKYAEHHTQAARLLEALEGFIDDLIKQGYRQVYPDIYKSFEDDYLDEDERFQNKDD